MKIRIQYIAITLFIASLILSSCSKESIEDTDAVNLITTEAENVLQVEQELLSIVNEYRTSLGKNTLEFSEVAYKYANEHTNYMVAKGTTNHDNFNTRASDIAAKTKATLVSENVAKDYSNANQALQGWLASNNHKKTIEGKFTHTAISVKRNTAGKLYFTQLFYKK